MKTKNIVVAVSGGFDPIHIGHVRMIREAKKLGDKLVVIMNNDNWLKHKKGYAFMSENERKEILEAIKGVDEVRPDIFAKGGDRHIGNIPEVAVCEEIGCKIVSDIGDGGKVQSSSWLLKKFSENLTGN
ncbi:MAG: Glycerol-3-phosphate cytidylyltransferase [Parcubacteria group bacterium GW2011_GWC1_40_13]|nr:MAG: Glycerol-3-phosphate cytidylyltransferase [Parcubacteria group bacterium GW2011_GWC1_40_13]